MDPELRARLLKSYHEQNMKRAMERKARSAAEVVRRELPSIRELDSIDLVMRLNQSKFKLLKSKVELKQSSEIKL